MMPEEAAKLEVGDLIIYQEKTQDPELGLIVGKSETTINIDWFQATRQYVGTYRIDSPPGNLFWYSVEKVS